MVGSWVQVRIGWLLLAAYGLVLAMGIVFGALAFVQLQRTTEQLEDVVSDSAQTVIEVERLRTASDRFGLAVRSYLLTPNVQLQKVTEDAAAQFREALRALAFRRRGSESSGLIEQIRQLDSLGQRALPHLLASPPRSLSQEKMVESVEQHGYPLRDRVDALIAELSRTEGLRFRDAAHEATVAAARATRLLSVLAAISLAVACGASIALIRTLRLLGRSRKELEHSVQKLETVNQDLDAFVGRIAHDLRNVISPLRLIAGVLEHKRGDSAALERCAVRLKRIGRTADALIGSYLIFARSGEPADPKESTGVQQVLAEVMDDLAPVAAERRARLEVQGEDAAVLCSRSLLHTVFMNLIGNGLKFLEGGARREVSVSVRALPDRCEISVRDGGQGMPADAQVNIFKPFYRLPGANAPGTGIGLATVSRIVKAHGGRVNVQSAPGEGSTFIVSLPRADTRSAGDAPALS